MPGPNLKKRRDRAIEIRVDAASLANPDPFGEQTPNSDENTYRTADQLFSSALGNYSKGLPHSPVSDCTTTPGEADPQAYDTFVKVLNSGDSAGFESIPVNALGDQKRYRKLADPQSGLCFDLEGPDPQALRLPPAFSISSAEAAGEMAELYWMAVLRDIPFDDFSKQPGDPTLQSADGPEVAQRAAADLSRYAKFVETLKREKVTAKTLFRSDSAGTDRGSYVSQFLLIGNTDAKLGLRNTDGLVSYGPFKLSQKQRAALAGLDYMTEIQSWLAVQNGEDFSGRDYFEQAPKLRYIRKPRDLATYVHFDMLYEAYLTAASYLINEMEAVGHKMVRRYPFNSGNAYSGDQVSKTQSGFATYGAPQILSLLAEVATRALKVVWYQKWFVHRRLRPETFGGRIHFHLTRDRKLYLNPDGTEIFDKMILDDLATGELSNFFGPGRNWPDYLLPQAYPEGSPTHPSYGAGHAAVAGACVTILKAFFKDVVFRNPVRVKPTPSGDELEEIPPSDPSYEDLTVHGELNKLAANIAIGRNMAGVHYFSDYQKSRDLGETIGISVLREQAGTYHQKLPDGAAPFFELTKFDGSTERITNS
jgi:membrane-associated phospholipid phosphatase